MRQPCQQQHSIQRTHKPSRRRLSCHHTCLQEICIVPKHCWGPLQAGAGNISLTCLRPPPCSWTVLINSNSFTHHPQLLQLLIAYCSPHHITIHTTMDLSMPFNGNLAQCRRKALLTQPQAA